MDTWIIAMTVHSWQSATLRPQVPCSQCPPESPHLPPWFLLDLESSRRLRNYPKSGILSTLTVLTLKWESNIILETGFELQKKARMQNPKMVLSGADKPQKTWTYSRDRWAGFVGIISSLEFTFRHRSRNYMFTEVFIVKQCVSTYKNLSIP